MEFHDTLQAVPVPAPACSCSGDAAAAVAQVHAEIDLQTSRFAAQTGIACPSGCGQCCHSPQVEATVADMMPLASELVRQGMAAAVLDRLVTRSDDPRCILFAVDAHDASRGRCTMYQWRPSICRLFGFAGRRDADGNPQFSACRVHAETMPSVVAAARQAVAARRISLPILSDLAAQVRAVAPEGPSRPLSINEALRAALQTAALQDWMRSLQGEDDHDGDSPTPRIPPRRAA